MRRRGAKIEETFLIVEDKGTSGEETWRLRLVGESSTKEEALERAKAGVFLDYGDYFVIPAYRAELAYDEDPTPDEFKGVEPKGELPNPITQSQAEVPTE